MYTKNTEIQDSKGIEKTSTYHHQRYYANKKKKKKPFNGLLSSYLSNLAASSSTVGAIACTNMIMPLQENGSIDKTQHDTVPRNTEIALVGTVPSLTCPPLSEQQQDVHDPHSETPTTKATRQDFGKFVLMSVSDKEAMVYNQTMPILERINEDLTQKKRKFHVSTVRNFYHCLYHGVGFAAIAFGSCQEETISRSWQVPFFIYREPYKIKFLIISPHIKPKAKLDTIELVSIRTGQKRQIRYTLIKSLCFETHIKEQSERTKFRASFYSLVITDKQSATNRQVRLEFNGKPFYFAQQDDASGGIGSGLVMTPLVSTVFCRNPLKNASLSLIDEGISQAPNSNALCFYSRIKELPFEE
jgi:hypothetical protein